MAIAGDNGIKDSKSFTNGGQVAAQSIRFLIENTISVTGKEFFCTLVKSISEILGVNYVFIAKCIDKEGTKVRTLAFWEKNRYADNIEYGLDGTPCRDVISGKFCCYDGNLLNLFPNDEGLKNYDAESYFGVPIYNSKNSVIGHLAAFHNESFKDISSYYSILRIFALRAGSEMERMEYEDSLQQSNNKLAIALEEIQKLKRLVENENLHLKEEISTVYNFDEIIGESKLLKEVLQQVEMVAITDSNVLIRGNTGTGKEMIARAIHKLSPRADRALVKVNCPAIPDGLIESELFGHEKGAFTGALTSKIGKFELADGGTIFLDELGDLPLDAQAKLLRVLQEREFERVGSNETRKVDVRVIAATNRDLETAVRDGKFRADLYFRLNVFPIVLPSLVERKEDIPHLANYFTQKYANKLGKSIRVIRREDIEKMKNYSWPGNIRELENIIDRAVIITRGDSLNIECKHIASTLDAGSNSKKPFSLEENEREHISEVLKKTNWQIHGEKGAAKILGINPSTLRSRIVKLGIKKEVRVDF